MTNGPALRDVQLLHANPFGQGMLDALREDLKHAIWTRFMVCYFTGSGSEALAPYLGDSLQHHLSRGLFTLTCSCGSSAIEELARALDLPHGRLRVFLRLEVTGSEEDAKSIHSKMAFIVRPRANLGSFETPYEAVLYVGSHNWTSAGLGLRASAKKGINVETSLRVVADWDPGREAEWLEYAEYQGSVGEPTGNAMLDAIAQMHRCHCLASSTDLADPRASDDMANWIRANCTAGTSPGSTPFIVSTAVLAADVDEARALNGRSDPQASGPRLPRKGDTLYVQHYQGFDEPDVFDSRVTWAFLVWETREALRRAEAPWLILGRARNLGQNRVGDPNLRRVEWIAYDPGQNTARGTSAARQHLAVPASSLFSGDDLEVEYWSVSRVAPGVESEALNARTPDRYALVEVVAVRRPRMVTDSEWVDHDNGVWDGTELPFHNQARRRRRRVYVVYDGKRPSPARANAMRREQAQLFSLGDRPTHEPDIFGEFDESVAVGHALPAEHDRGPIGDVEYEQADVYRCEAPINDLLFGRHRTERRLALRDNRERESFILQVDRAEVNRFERKERRVPRMERLFAPGVPYVATRLGLDYVVLNQLGLKL